MDYDVPDRLRCLLLIPGVSGFEAPVAEAVRAAVGQRAPLREDPLGNVITTVGRAAGPRLLLMAHMDETGLLTSHIEESGAVRFRTLGGIDDRVLPGRHVEIQGDRAPVPGVIGLAPPHLSLPGDRDRVLGWHELAIDIGVESAMEAAALGVKRLQPVSPRRTITCTPQGRLTAWALDDRVGCHLLLDLLDRALADPPPYSVSFAWTTQDEIGLRGAQALAAQERFDCVLSIDAVRATDVPGASPTLPRMALGEGPVLRWLDAGAMASRELFEMTEALARAIGVPTQRGMSEGEDQAKWFQPQGARILPLNLAMRSMHTEVETVDLGDLAGLARLMEALLRELPSLARQWRTAC